MCHICRFYCLQSGCKVLQRHQIHDNLTLCRLVLTSAENTRLHARIPRTIHRLFCSDENSSQKLLSSLVCKLLYFIRLVVSCLCYKKKIHTFLRFPTCILHRLNITTLRLKITTLWIRLLESLDSQATQT